MATTTNLGLIQPTVGGDTDAWGGYLNSDLGYIDALFGIAGTSVTLHVNNQNIASSSHKFDQIKMGDDRPLQFGAAPDYWLVYNSSGTQFELRGTNVDGSGTDGLILKVADGTDDVAFTGQIQGASGVIAGTAISVGGDTTSGFYRGGPNIVNLSNAGALTASFDASNVSTIQNLSVAGDGATVTGIKDEDNMSSNSATKLATQQSIKAYVDAQVGSFDTLAEVLAAGNTTGSTDIVVTSGQKITTNTISETTGASGVTIEGTQFKDDVINIDTSCNLYQDAANVLKTDDSLIVDVNLTVNGTITGAAPAGSLTGTTLKSTVVASSLTSVGTIGTGVWNGTAVAPGFGGTGLSSYSAGDILYATGSSTLAKLAKGSDTQVLTLASGLPSWVAPTVGDITGITAGTGLSGTDLTGPVPTLNVDASQTQITAVGTLGTGTWSATTIAVDKGGSGLTSYTAGDLLYATGSTTLAKLAKQTDGQVLTLASGLPTWATNPVGDLTAIVAGSGLTGSDLSGPIPTLNVVGTSSRISVSADAVDIDSGYVGQTSITTLGTIGTGTWRGTTVEVDQGGTGKSSYTAGDLLVASSGTALAALARGASGQVLTMSGTSLTWAAPTVGDITNVIAGAGMTGGGDSGDVTLNVIGTADKITVSSDAITIASGYVGQSSITTLGTIGTGTWSADTIAVNKGGTGLASYAAGDIVYASGATTLAKLAKGSDTEVLTLASGVPTWAAPTVGDITGITAGTGLSGTNLTGPVPTLNVEASQTQITALGTIGTGTWQAAKVASAYLDDDTAHLSGTQTFSGAKTFSATLTASGTIDIGADTNLYRSAANVLKTDDTFIAGTKFGMGMTPPAARHASFTSGAASTSLTVTNSTAGTGDSDGLLIQSNGLTAAIGNMESGDFSFYTNNNAGFILRTASLNVDFVAGITVATTSALTGNVQIGPSAPNYGPLTVKQGAADYYGIVIEESASDGWIRMGHNGVRGAIHTTWNSSRGATPLTLGTSASVTQLVLNTDGSTTVGGALAVTGALSKGSGSFKIDHPLPAKTDTHHLVHSFIEGPRADLIYRGVAALAGGSATVDLDAAADMSAGTWELLCRDPQCWIQNDSGWSGVRGSVQGNTLTIECEDATSTDSVSWMVVAERCDPHIIETGWTDDDGRVIVEPLKIVPTLAEEV